MDQILKSIVSDADASLKQRKKTIIPVQATLVTCHVQHLLLRGAPRAEILACHFYKKRARTKRRFSTSSCVNWRLNSTLCTKPSTTPSLKIPKPLDTLEIEGDGTGVTLRKSSFKLDHSASELLGCLSKAPLLAFSREDAAFYKKCSDTFLRNMFPSWQIHTTEMS